MKHSTLFNFALIMMLFTAFNIGNAQSSAIYDVTFNSLWNATNHTSVPSSDHYSKLVGATHKTENAYFEAGKTASTGLKNVAELGSNSAFMSEVNNSPNTKTWLSQSFSPNNASGSVTIANVEVTEEHHLLSLVSMIAPSPDWFIAINSLDLRNETNTDWKPTFTIDVFVYDAGTDSGTNYASANMVTMPQAPISRINGAPFNGNKIGELVVTFKSKTLSNTRFKTNEKLKLFPNPSQGNLSVSGQSILNLTTIQIYNVLGSKVKEIRVSKVNNRLDLNLSDLKKGVYLVNFIEKNGTSKTQKLVLQ